MVFFAISGVRNVGRRLTVGVFAVAVLAGCSGPSSDLAGDESAAELLALTDASGEQNSADFAEPEPERERLSAEEIAAFEMPPVPQVDEVSANADSATSESIEAAASSPEVEILSTVTFDDSPTESEVEAYGDGLPRTASGRLISLDPPAQVACANAEMAIWAVDEGDIATSAELRGRVVELLGQSQSEGIQAWATALGAENEVDPVSLVGFLEACVAAGHDL